MRSAKPYGRYRRNDPFSRYNQRAEQTMRSIAAGIYELEQTITREFNELAAEFGNFGLQPFDFVVDALSPPDPASLPPQFQTHPYSA